VSSRCVSGPSCCERTLYQPTIAASRPPQSVLPLYSKALRGMRCVVVQ